MNDSKSVFIVMPAYNEEANIIETINQWYPILDYANEQSKLVVATKGSSDKTETIIKNLKNDYPKLELLDTKYKEHGPKLIALYKYAIDSGSNWIFQTDSDGQTNAQEFKKFWNQKDKYDAILGHRNNRGDGASRIFVEKIVCKLLKAYFDVSVPDANAPFRLMKSSLVAKYIDNFEDSYNLPNIMLTAFFANNKEKIRFETISFKPREKGINSININKIIKIGINALKDFREFKKQM